MNLLETLKNQVGSQLSNLESQIKALTEKSTEDTNENTDSSSPRGVVQRIFTGIGGKRLFDTLTPSSSNDSTTEDVNDPIDQQQTTPAPDKGVAAEVDTSNIEAKKANTIEAIGATVAGSSAFEVLKNVLNKGVDTYKETVTRIDSSGSVTDAAKNALAKGTRTIKDVAANLNDSDSVADAAKNIFKKGIDTVKEIKSGVNSTGSIADTAKSTLNMEKKDHLHISASETVEKDSDKIVSVTENTTKIDVDNAVEETASTIADAITSLETETGSARDSMTKPAENVLSRETKRAKQNTAELDTAASRKIEAVAEELRETNIGTVENAAADNINPVFDRVDNILNDIADKVDETPLAEKITTGADSVSDQSTSGAKTIGSALAMGATTKTSHVEAKSSPATLGLDSSSWTVNKDSEIDSSSVEPDKLDDTVISGSESYQNVPVSSSIAKVEKSKLNWVLLPMVLLLGLSVAWWLKIDQNRQFAEEVDFAALEPANSESSEMSSVDVGMNGDSFSSSSVATENPVTMTEVTGLVERTEPAKEQVIGDVLLAESNDTHAVASISNNPGATTTSSAQIESDRRNNRSDSGAEQVAVTQMARVTNSMNGGAITRNPQSSSSVEAITTFLESDRNALPPAFTLHGLTFRIASSTITRNSRKIVSDLAAALKTHPTTMIRLEGHTDNRGKPDSNRALSASRASAVRTALVNLNLDPARITAQGLGSDHPIADNDTKVGRLKNRRVDVIITER